jgi:hypothetical protein
MILKYWWSDIWDLIKAVANPKGLGANHPKYRTTVLFLGLLIHISAFRKKHDRRLMLLGAPSEQDPFRLGDIVKHFWDVTLVRRQNNRDAC